MKRKILLITVLMFLSVSICISSFAAGNMVNSIRNAVGGTENVVENGVKGVTGAITNMGNNMANSMSDNNNNNNDNNNGTMRTGTDNTYQATRTATTGTDTTGTFGGMTSNMWTWVILAVAAVGIIALVWSYSSDNSKHE